VIHHLIPAADWDAAAGGALRPASLDSEGFVHCSPDDATVLMVANAFYRDVTGPMVVLDLHEDRLGHELRWEPPAHPDGREPSPDEAWFPHLYGPIEPTAVAGVRHVQRRDDGTYTAIVT
jgi:uncharacterized protein